MDFGIGLGGFNASPVSIISGAIEAWHPPKMRDETQYQEHLANFFRARFPKQNTVERESGRGLCDLCINTSIGKVGVELKKDLGGKSEIERLIGQISGFKREYVEIIIVLVGKTNKDVLAQLIDRRNRDMRDQSSGFGIVGFGQPTPKQIPIFDKGE